MIRTFANRTVLLLAVFTAALALHFEQVSTGIIEASEEIIKHEVYADQIEILEKELLQLENLTRIHHDQQMKRWDSSLMAAGVTPWPCPDASLISPCTCITSGAPLYNLDIDCSAVKSDNDLIVAFGTLFPFDDIDRLLIDGVDADHKVPITNFMQNIFNTKSFSLISISDTTLERIEESVFQLSHDTLASLSLERNNLQLFPFEIISEYTQLTFIHMPTNDILELPMIQSASLLDINMNNNNQLILLDEALTFVGTPALRTVRLASTSITRIPAHLFSTLDHISTIYFTNNGIEELEENAINAPKATIKTLALSGNSISTVRVGAITGMAGDGVIDLSDNQITILEQRVWEDILKQLNNDGALILDGNPLKCGCEINWIMINEAEYKRKLSPGSRCYTGDLVSDLNLEFLLANCKQTESASSPSK